jgi:hypothetical protein
MTQVTARKIRDHSRGSLGGGPLGRVYRGLLVSYPTVGRGMIIFSDPLGHRMVTSPVTRVLGNPDSGTVYVETENSVYRLTFHEEKVGEGKAA